MKTLKVFVVCFVVGLLGAAITAAFPGVDISRLPGGSLGAGLLWAWLALPRPTKLDHYILGGICGLLGWLIVALLVYFY